jgi:FKBP-type peptidyl-prolyl cis-trans isomerase FklB
MLNAAASCLRDPNFERSFIMKARLSLFLCGMLLAVPAIAAEKKELKTLKEKSSYAIGLDMGGSLKKNGIEVDQDALNRGIKDALTGSKPLMTDEEMKESIMALQKDLQTKRAEKNKSFLEENKKKDGVVALPSGLQYKVLTPGTGKTPKATDSVTVNYKGTLIDGTEFDSSYKRGQPATFPVNGVIPGWTEALQLMKEGAKWQLVLPPNIGYGERGAGQIPPNSVLIFEVELISVNPAATEGEAAPKTKPETKSDGKAAKPKSGK